MNTVLSGQEMQVLGLVIIDCLNIPLEEKWGFELGTSAFQSKDTSRLQGAVTC